MKHDALARYYSELGRLSFSPGWARPEPSMWPAPKPKFRPAVWRFAAARQALSQAGEFVPVEQAERRNLIMVNPIEGNIYASTRNLVAAYQCVKGGESARTHRHSPAALRLVLEAKPGTYTVVNGARVDMLPGDVVLTPSWSWHGHVNETDETSFWIDFLDIPFVQLTEAMFFEQYPGGGIEAVKTTGPTPFRIPAAEALGGGRDAKLVEIAKGIMPTIALHLMRQPAGGRIDAAKTTTNNIYAVASGKVRFTADGGFDATLEPGDVVAMPCWHSHGVEAVADAVVLRVSDEPLLAKLGLGRTAS
ncbi:MAG TPA: cupin domain-containing protein [Xanthobacteraceae bacterium]|nr:cupin domain-containing protein [Xanthobacteraceae bacterium]